MFKYGELFVWATEKSFESSTPVTSDFLLEISILSFFLVHQSPVELIIVVFESLQVEQYR